MVVIRVGIGSHSGDPRLLSNLPEEPFVAEVVLWFGVVDFSGFSDPIERRFGVIIGGWIENIFLVGCLKKQLLSQGSGTCCKHTK